MDKLLARLKVEWDKNPLQVIIVGSMAATALAKLLDARNNAVGRRIYRQEVNRRIRNSR